ncbi:hypothetical protein EI94DRAFT_1801393 [Lactarius quietus]|nr:hypothetical protein EI94DRAFT_1801393 [Lactarius quietus]
MKSSHGRSANSDTTPDTTALSLQSHSSSGDTSYVTYDDPSVERIPWTKRLKVQAQGETQSHRRATTFDMLPADVLLEIFYSYQTDDDFWSPLIPPSCRWLTLAHVCRTWRQVVFGSPCRLDLQLLCTHGTPVRKNLGFWPPLPLIMNYGYDRRLTSDDEDNLFAALEHIDRICHVYLRLPNSQFSKVVTEMQEPFPALKQLTLLSEDGNASVLPGGFLGRAASCLQRLTLRGIIFQGLPALLLSSERLVRLDLHNIPRDGYISTDAMVACLAASPTLENILLGFHSAPPRHYRMRLPLATRTVLPSLTYIEFRGTGEYLEELLSQINSPRLNQVNITYFNQLVDLQAAQPFELIDRSENLELTQLTHAFIAFTSRSVSLEINQCCHPNWVPVRTSIVCQGIDWQVSHIAQVLNQPSAILSHVVHLDLVELGADEDPQLESMDKCEWLHLLRPFFAVETLHITPKLASHVALAMEDVTEEMVPNVLPALNSIRLLGTPASSFDKVVAVRRLSGHPVTVTVVNTGMVNIGMQNIHITRSSERAEQADLVLENAKRLLEQHKDAVISRALTHPLALHAACTHARLHAHPLAHTHCHARRGLSARHVSSRMPSGPWGKHARTRNTLGFSRYRLCALNVGRGSTRGSLLVASRRHCPLGRRRRIQQRPQATHIATHCGFFLPPSPSTIALALVALCLVRIGSSSSSPPPPPGVTRCAHILRPPMRLEALRSSRLVATAPWDEDVASGNARTPHAWPSTVILPLVSLAFALASSSSSSSGVTRRAHILRPHATPTPIGFPLRVRPQSQP